jgi:four helix bundle protein
MFDAFEVSLQLIGALRGPVAQLQSHDGDLAAQLRRAASSVSLNLGEGRRRAGRDRAFHFRVAAGSAGEVRAALLVAQAWRHVDAAAVSQPLALVDRVLAMCWRLAR